MDAGTNTQGPFSFSSATNANEKTFFVSSSTSVDVDAEKRLSAVAVDQDVERGPFSFSSATNAHEKIFFVSSITSVDVDTEKRLSATSVVVDAEKPLFATSVVVDEDVEGGAFAFSAVS